jgi:hypothetical protein
MKSNDFNASDAGGSPADAAATQATSAVRHAANPSIVFTHPLWASRTTRITRLVRLGTRRVREQRGGTDANGAAFLM